MGMTHTHYDLVMSRPVVKQYAFGSFMQFSAGVLSWQKALPTSLTKMVVLPYWIGCAQEGFEVSCSVFWSHGL